MNLDQQLSQTLRHVAEQVDPPDVTLDGIRSRAHASRRRTLAATAAAALLTLALAGIPLLTGGRDTTAPPVAPEPTGELFRADLRDPSRCVDKGIDGERPQEPGFPAGPGLQAWMDDLPVGEPPLSPYWHDGVLHARGVQVPAPYASVVLEAAGETVLVGGFVDDSRFEEGGTWSPQWMLVRGDQLTPLPVPENQSPRLSADGRIAFWADHPTAETTRFVTWDTGTNAPLASRTVPGNTSLQGSLCRIDLLGIDAAGIGLVLDEASKAPVARWDVRADTVAPTDLTYDPTKRLNQFDAFKGLESAFVSPDGTREVFTEAAPGDSPAGCCGTQLRVRPNGPSDQPGDIVTLQLPQGIPSMRLWDARTDRGTWMVWWETTQTVLFDASVDNHSYLVRCSTRNGACERVLDLGRNSNEGAQYAPDWESDWAFARAPAAE
ncbi:hypothetical protein GCM10023168_14620 [Fodinibacter luteus]|uniref:WD40 repeat protein n=1 Tax=Fodinibacter luteus TaxID=552064 RepID=A0ABP8KBL2_9MICO